VYAPHVCPSFDALYASKTDALSFAADRVSWVGSANYNRIRNFATLTPGQPDPLGGPDTVTIFGAASEPVVVKGLDWVGTWQATPALSASLGLEKSHYRFSPGTLGFARPEERAYLTLDFDAGPWELSAKATRTGSQDLRKCEDYAGTPRYNLDGSPKPDKSPSFTTVDLRAQYRVDKRIQAFIGADNVFDFQQAKKDSQLWVDADGALDVTHIWGPNRGRYVYGGVKVSF
jgi:outer membrane receptor for ferrienterochelin and colicins